MNDGPNRRSIRSIAVTIVALLLVLTGVGVSLSTGTAIPLASPTTTSQTFTVDEATYYEYVAPRLERLVKETDNVVELVRTRSRNVIALSVHGNRIDTLASDIRAYGTTHPVPARFAAVHQQILDGTKKATSAIADAKTALRRFDFSGIPQLIPQFEAGSETLHTAWDAMTAIANATPVAPASGSSLLPHR
jgi:hypothetical protein